MKLQNKEAQEFRLQQIITLHEQGYQQIDIAQMLNCSQPWVSKVILRAETFGKESLVTGGSAPGNRAALQAGQLADLTLVLKKEARAAGFPTDGWTCGRIAEVIFERYAVRHHPSHISRLLRAIGFTRQKPQRCDYRHSERAVKTWRSETLPAVKKK